jgi:hypothetical protein
MALDYAQEVPSHGDHFGGPAPRAARITVAGRPVTAVGGMSPGDRVLTSLPPADPTGAGVLLAALAAGAGLILLRSGDAAAVARAERVTATAGMDVADLVRLG